MDKSLVARMSWSRLKHNKMRTLLMILVVAISIASISIIIAVSQGTKAKIAETLDSVGATDIMIVTASSNSGITPGNTNSTNTMSTTLTNEDGQAIFNQINGIEEFTSTQIKKANVKYENSSVGTTIFGVPANWFDLQYWDVSSGELLTESDVNSMARVAVIGKTVATNLFNEADPIGKTIMINQVPFTVKGVLAEKGASSVGDSDNRVIIPETTFSKRVFNVTYVNQLLIRVSDPKQMDELQQSITLLLQERHQIGPGENNDFQVRIPSDVLARKMGITGSFTILMFIIGFVVLIAGGIMVLNLMLTSVKERTSEIGLYKAIGATNKDIQQQFFAESLYVSLLGGVAGIILGILIIALIKVGSSFPIIFSWLAFVIGFIFSIIVGMTTGILPAKRAAELNPVEALRNE